MNDIFDLLKKISNENNKGEASPSPVSWVIAGLGNPGKQYENNRHNTGFKALDRIAAEYGIQITSSKFSSLCGKGRIGADTVLLIKPQTLMNRSGLAVGQAMDFYKLPLSNLIVLCDDITLDIGTIRIRRKGSDGGQKGVRDIIENRGSNDFCRIKIGVGQKPCPEYDLAAWVLSDISKADADSYSQALDKVLRSVPLIISGETERAMQLYN